MNDNGRMWDEYDKALNRIAALGEEVETLRDTIRDNEAYFIEQKNAYAVLYANAQMERAGRERAEAVLEKALDWLMAKHGGRLDAAESIDAELYDILNGALESKKDGMR